MRYLLFATAMGLAYAGSPAAAQPHPSFAGRWTLVADSATSRMSASGRGVIGPLGSEAVLTQDERVLTISRRDSRDTVNTTYNFDGSPSTNQTEVGTVVSRLRWDGERLVMVSSTGAFQVTIVFALVNGRLLLELTPPGSQTPIRFTYTKA